MEGNNAFHESESAHGPENKNMQTRQTSIVSNDLNTINRPVRGLASALASISLLMTAIAPVVAGPIPPRVMLDEQGSVTPVRNQGGRFACQTFAAVAAIECEYLRQYGISLDLSEEYLINMFNESAPPNWTGGDVSDKLLAASYYALPRENVWPYIDNENVVIAAFDQALGLTQGSFGAN